MSLVEALGTGFFCNRMELVLEQAVDEEEEEVDKEDIVYEEDGGEHGRG